MKRGNLKRRTCSAVQVLCRGDVIGDMASDAGDHSTSPIESSTLLFSFMNIPQQ